MRKKQPETEGKGPLGNPDEAQSGEIFTIEEAARYLKVGREAIDEAIRTRRLKVIQLCRSRRNLRIFKQDLLAMRGFVR